MVVSSVTEGRPTGRPDTNHLPWAYAKGFAQGTAEAVQGLSGNYRDILRLTFSCVLSFPLTPIIFCATLDVIGYVTG